jgi:hypothetical protein
MKLAAAKKPDLKQADGDSNHYRFPYIHTHEDKQARCTFIIDFIFYSLCLTIAQ